MIRETVIEDSPRIAEIHVFGWRCAYKEFISIDFLINEFTVKKREEKHREFLLNKDNESKTYVYEENNILKAFMTIGNCRDEDKTDQTFEIWGIYVDPLFQRQNIGKQLVNYCVKEAKINKKNEIVLWVFEKNYASIKFYEKMGFSPDKKVKWIEHFSENSIRMVKSL